MTLLDALPDLSTVLTAVSGGLGLILAAVLVLLALGGYLTSRR